MVAARHEANVATAELLPVSGDPDILGDLWNNDSESTRGTGSVTDGRAKGRAVAEA